MNKQWAWWRVYDTGIVELHYGWITSHASGVSINDGSIMTGKDKGVYIWMGVLETAGIYSVYTDPLLFEEA